MDGLVGLATIDAFLAYHHCKESPVIAVLANTYDTLDLRCEKSSVKIVCCTPALYVWLVSHFFVMKVGLSVLYKVITCAPKRERQTGRNSWQVW